MYYTFIVCENSGGGDSGSTKTYAVPAAVLLVAAVATVV